MCAKKWNHDNSHLLRYHAEIEAGRIIVGQELWMELCNLKEDLHNDYFYYDTADADLRIDFMENCVRLTKSPFYNKPMILMLWQKAFIEAIYSFKMSATGFDRFKRSLLLIARKNTKSETCSALGLSEFIVGLDGADIACTSNDDNQASIVYDAIDTMRQLIDPYDLDTHRNQRFLLNKVTNTKIFKLSDRTRNKEGRNIDLGFVDEANEMQQNTIVKPIEQSQSLKDNPKLIIITTEGFVQDGFLDDELKRARKVITKEDENIANMRYLPWLYTQDSESEIWQNPKSWSKSNPTVGIVKKWDYLEEQVEIAKTSKADRMFVLAKDFNIKQNSSESWLNYEDYMYEATYDLESFRGCYCLGGVDLAETTDLSNAKALMMKPGDPTKYIYSHYFIPESKLIDSDDASVGAKYKEWAKEGYVTITEGNEVDLAVVADWFWGLYKEHGIRLMKCGYDQRFCRDFLNQMENYGWYKDMEDVVMIHQNPQTMSNAIKLIERDFQSQIINYNQNPVDQWCLKNAGIKVNDKGEALLVKTESTRRIDGAVNLAILYEMYRRYKSDLKMAIESGGKK